MKNPAVYNYPILVGAILLLTSCAGGKQGDTYGDAWGTVVASEQWETAASQPSASPSLDQTTYFALPDLEQITDENVDPAFIERYPKLVSRAYFRLISEALDADRRIARSYQQLYSEAAKPQNAANRIVQEDLEAARKRFLAHRRMLEGLRSWKSFNPYGSDDLDFFLEEQLRVSYALHRKGAADRRIVDHLMTELADLFHKYGEGRGSVEPL